MIVPIDIQVNLIINGILAGILTGILFDVYRIIRGFENPNSIVTLIEDVLFWIFAGILIFIFLIYNSYVYMSVYLFFYISIGLILYIRFMSKRVLKFQYKFMSGLFRIVRIMKNFIIYPVEVLIYKIIGKNK